MAALINPHSKKCIFVIGPTASGKSSWALAQAKKYNGSIVNIDSVQFYKNLIVGSAAPTELEKSEVPHYLFSYVQPPNEMTAGTYINEFYKLLELDIKFPLFIVGGTGFYIQALEKGMFDVEPVPIELKNKIEHELLTKGSEALHQELLSKDPLSKIHTNDHYRIVRALEIIRATGKTPTELRLESEKNKTQFPFEYIKVGFDFSKEEYVQRVKSRTANMIKSGIINEVQKCIDENLTAWAPLGSVGYKETLDFLLTNKSLLWLETMINQSTMQLIKKQKTWFKRDSAILWSNQENRLDQFLSSV